MKMMVQSINAFDNFKKQYSLLYKVTIIFNLNSFFRMTFWTVLEILP